MSDERAMSLIFFGSMVLYYFGYEHGSEWAKYCRTLFVGLAFSMFSSAVAQILRELIRISDRR